MDSTDLSDGDVKTLLSIEGNREYLARLQERYDAGLMSPFIGAGMSVGFGFPLWDKMLLRIAEFMELEDDSEFQKLHSKSLPKAATYLLGETGAAQPYKQALIQIFSDQIEVADKPASLQICQLLRMSNLRSPIFTTNYDKAIESHAASLGMRFDKGREPIVGTQVKQIVDAVDHRHFVLVKLHGDVGQIEGRIDSLESYNRAYNKDDGYLLHVFRKMVFARSLLFIGCSLRDKTAEIMSRDFNANVDEVFEHFAVVEATKENQPNRRQRNFLLRRGIKPIWIPQTEFGYIHTILLGLTGGKFSKGPSSALAHLAIHREAPQPVPHALADDTYLGKLIAGQNRVPESLIATAEHDFGYFYSRIDKPVSEWLAAVSQFAVDATARIAVVLSSNSLPKVLAFQLARDLCFFAKSKNVDVRCIPVACDNEAFTRQKIGASFECVSIGQVKGDVRLQEYGEHHVFLSDRIASKQIDVTISSESPSLMDAFTNAYPDTPTLQYEYITWRNDGDDGEKRRQQFDVRFDSGRWSIGAWPPLRSSNGDNVSEVQCSGDPHALRWGKRRLTVSPCANTGCIDIAIVESATDFAKLIYGDRDVHFSFLRVVWRPNADPVT